MALNSKVQKVYCAKPSSQCFWDFVLLSHDGLCTPTKVWLRVQRFGDSGAERVPKSQQQRGYSKGMELKWAFSLEREQVPESALSGMFKIHKNFTSISKLLRIPM